MLICDGYICAGALGRSPQKPELSGDNSDLGKGILAQEFHSFQRSVFQNIDLYICAGVWGHSLQRLELLSGNSVSGQRISAEEK